MEDTALTENTDLAEEAQFAGETDLAVEVDSIKEPIVLDEVETSFNLFEQRQLQYFIGKKLEENIILDDGEVLLAGECITPDIVTHITTRSTLMEVTSLLKKN